MNVSMGLRTRLRLTKVAAILPSMSDAEAAAGCEELAGAGVGMVLAEDERTYQAARQGAGYDAIVGIIANPSLALSLGVDVSVADRFPIPKPHKYGLRGLVCESADTLKNALDSAEVDFLLVPSELAEMAEQQAPANKISAKPWFVCLSAPNQTIDEQTKRVFLNYHPESWSAGSLKALWPAVSKSWGEDMRSYTFQAFG